MMRRKRKHIIFALVALLCQNDILCCVASRCKRVEDINPPTCNIEDLSDKVLLDICERIGLTKNKKKYPKREIILQGAKMCLVFAGQLNDIVETKTQEKAQQVVSSNINDLIYGSDQYTRYTAAQKIVDEFQLHSKKRIGECGGRKDGNSFMEYASCLQFDAQLLHVEYRINRWKEKSLFNKNKIDWISHLLSEYKYAPDEEKIMRQLLVTLIEKEESSSPAVIDTTTSRCEQLEDLDSPSCNEEILLGSEKHKLEHLSDEELRSICARVGSKPLLKYDQNQKPMDLTREELLKSATTCHNMIKISKPALDELYLAYLTMMEDKSLVSKYRYRHDRIIYLLSKQQSMDYDDKKLLSHMLFNKLGEEGVESLAVDTNFYSHEVWNLKRPGTYMPTPEEIAKLPQWEYVSKRRDMFKKLRFGKDWHMEIFQENGKAILAIGEIDNTCITKIFRICMRMRVLKDGTLMIS